MNDQAILTFDATPRPVPLSVRPSLYFGGIVAQMGWFFFGFGMVFVWIFVLNSDIAALWQFSGPIQTVDGSVTATHETSYSEGGDEDTDGTPIYEIAYRFTDETGVMHDGVCYRVGWGPSPGKPVKVEYPAGRPELSRIEHTRRKPFGWFVVFTLIFPVIGLCMAAPRLACGPRISRLLRWGRLGAGDLVDKAITPVTVNNCRVYKLTFEFTDIAGRIHRAATKTHEVERLEDDASELLLYDPMRPGRAVFLDNLPGRAQIDDHGYLIGLGMRGLAVLALPVVSVVAHAVVAWLRLG